MRSVWSYHKIWQKHRTEKNWMSNASAVWEWWLSLVIRLRNVGCNDFAQQIYMWLHLKLHVSLSLNFTQTFTCCTQLESFRKSSAKHSICLHTTVILLQNSLVDLFAHEAYSPELASSDFLLLRMMDCFQLVISEDVWMHRNRNWQQCLASFQVTLWVWSLNKMRRWITEKKNFIIDWLPV